MKLLEGKVALITGAARGIGKAIALKYAAEGADIAFTDLVIDEIGQQTEAEIAALGVKAKGSTRLNAWWHNSKRTLATSTSWSTTPASLRTASCCA